MTLRVGVVGVGRLGGFHARIYRENEKSELVCVCDADTCRAEAAVEGIHLILVTHDEAQQPDQVTGIPLAFDERAGSTEAVAA